MEIEEVAERIVTHLATQPAQSQEAMNLKLALEISASKLFLALGWLLREGRIVCETSEFGYLIQCRAGVAQNPQIKVAEEV